MKNKRKLIVFGIIICIAIVASICEYGNIQERRNFSIKQITWDGEGKNWSDNTRGNIYEIKFGKFTGSDVKEIVSLKDSYKMSIDCKVESGDLTLKIYTTEKVIYEGSGSVKAIKELSGEESKDVKVEIVGKGAKGEVKIKLESI